jgi:site-specific recombinase XerD
VRAVGNRAGGQLLSRRGVRKIVDGHLQRLDLKRPGFSNHALRHIGATLDFNYTHDMSANQDLLGHGPVCSGRREGTQQPGHSCASPFPRHATSDDSP